MRNVDSVDLISWENFRMDLNVSTTESEGSEIKKAFKNSE